MTSLYPSWGESRSGDLEYSNSLDEMDALKNKMNLYSENNIKTPTTIYTFFIILHNTFHMNSMEVCVFTNITIVLKTTIAIITN